MSNEPTELPVFPATAPEVFSDPDATLALFDGVLGRLAEVIDIDDDRLHLRTPCAGFTVGQLQHHVLGWLGFFAEALADPDGATTRSDPDAFALAADMSPSDQVRAAQSSMQRSIIAGVAESMVVMSQARMSGDAVLAMALGEYIIHAWDLATATGQRYDAPSSAVQPAHDFLRGTVAPEYRGPDSGFFDDEVTVATDASDLERLLGFAGRDPAAEL